MDKYFVEYGALQERTADGPVRVLECDTSAMEARKVPEEFARRICEALNRMEGSGSETDGEMTFGMAIEAMKKGRKVARKGWNGKGMWICVPLCNGPKEISAKGIWGKPNAEYAEQNGGTVKVVPYVTMKASDGTIVMGWLASQTDMLSEDWVIVE